MVALGDARRAALREGALDKRRRTGGWKKKHFVLTPSHLVYFDAANDASASPRSMLATFDILTVEAHDADPQQRAFHVNLYRKRKEYRATSTEDRDEWLRVLASVAAFKNDGSKNEQTLGTPVTPMPLLGTTDSTVQDTTGQPVESTRSTEFPATAGDKVVESRDGSGRGLSVGPGINADLPELCRTMKKAFAKQVQTSKSFSSRDVVDFVCEYAHATRDQALDIGQQLIDAKLIVPLKSHIFDEDDSTSRFKFYDTVTQKQPKNHLNMRSQSIQDLMGTSYFNPGKYAEDFLRKHSSDRIEEHSEKLISQKERTIESLKAEISTNYVSFIHASAEIKKMENSVSQLKTLVMECRRTIQSMKGITLDTTPSARATYPNHGIGEHNREAEKDLQGKAVDGFIHDLEVYLHEHAYDEFTKHVLEYRRTLNQTPGYSSASQRERVRRLVQQFIGRLVEEFNASMQTSERMHKKEDHLRHLIQLGEPALATEMCLQNYSVRIALQLRHVPSYGNSLNYVINLSRTFFTSLLVCYEDYEHSFRGQESSHFISLTVWISAQLERFAREVLCHIFSGDMRADGAATEFSQITTSGRTQVQTHARASAIDVADFKSVTRFVSNALRYVFYGSRQLELAGLPTAHCLAPHLINGILSFMSSYGGSIRATSKEEVKKERWEMIRRTIRDAETKQDREIILTQSARSFYSMIQQFLRDIQRVLNPSCATSYISEVHEAAVFHADQLLIQYPTDVLNYLESPKLSSTIRLKHVVAILTNVAYLQDDCTTRSNFILQEFLPKTCLQNRELEAQHGKLWRRLVVIGMQKGAQSLLKMSIMWQDMDLSEESLPDMTVAKEIKTLFVTTLFKELNDISNDQLEKLLKKYRANGDNTHIDVNNDENNRRTILATMMLEGMLVEMTQDEAWWQQLRRGASGKNSRRIGYAGLNMFIAELRVLAEGTQSSKVIEEVGSVLVKMITDAYLQSHPEKREPIAPESWTREYVKMCMHQIEQVTSTTSLTPTNRT